MTGADVRTLHSRQLKGEVTAVEPARGEDRARSGRYQDAFFTDIEETDGQPRVLLEQIVPAAYLVATIEVEAVFDQTPGPRAGAVVDGDEP